MIEGAQFMDAVKISYFIFCAYLSDICLRWRPYTFRSEERDINGRKSQSKKMQLYWYKKRYNWPTVCHIWQHDSFLVFRLSICARKALNNCFMFLLNWCFLKLKHTQNHVTIQFFFIFFFYTLANVLCLKENSSQAMLFRGFMPQWA